MRRFPTPYVGPDSDPECTVVNIVINNAIARLKVSGTEIVEIETPSLTNILAFNSTYLSRSHSDINTYLSSTQPPLQIKSCHSSSLPHAMYDMRCQLVSDILKSPSHPEKYPQYLEHREACDELQWNIIGLMASNKVEVLIFPGCRIAVPRHENVDMWSKKLMDFPSNSLLGCELRLRVISLPVGLVDDVLPVGLEILGLSYAEQELLELVYRVEQLVKGRQAPTFDP